MKVRDVVSQIEKVFGRQPHQYINRLIADNSSLKPNDIPKELTNAKRQYLKTKKMLKEA